MRRCRMRPFLRFRICGRRSLHSVNMCPRPRVAGHLQQRHHVHYVGSHPAFNPTPYGVAIGSQAAGDLQPRQAGLLLEPLQPLREVVGDRVGYSAVVSALSRHLAGPSTVRTGTLSGGSGLTALASGRRTEPGTRAPEVRPLSDTWENPCPGGANSHPDIHMCGPFLLPKPAWAGHNPSASSMPPLMVGAPGRVSRRRSGSPPRRPQPIGSLPGSPTCMWR